MYRKLLLSEDADKHEPTRSQAHKEVLVWTLCKIVAPTKEDT